MKKSLIILFLVATSCSISQAQTVGNVESYGEKITPDNAIESNQINKMLLKEDSVHTKIVGTVETVCKKKGCWLKMDAGDGQTMMVRFYDYGFFVPKDCEGKKIVLEGSAYKTETSVEELKHYAEDAGKSKEEIAGITEAEKSISFEATGVLLYNE